MESITVRETQQEKVNLRIRIRKQLASISPREMQRSDNQLFERFLALPQVQEAKTIFLYLGITGLEPDTAKLIPTLIEMGKTVCVPRTIENHGMNAHVYRPGEALKKTAYGVMEPDADSPVVEKGSIDLALIPAICYDQRGYRLGFGAGYFDRWLADFTGMTVGLCREQIMRVSLPVEPHDRPVDILLTERETFTMAGE